MTANGTIDGPALANGDGASLLTVAPRTEVIIGGPYAGRAGKGLLLSRAISEVVRQFGRRVYELMLYDSAVNCAFELLKAGILSDGMRLSPALKIDPGEVVSKRKRKAQLKLSDEICDAAIRTTAGLEEPIETTCDDMLSAFAFGCSLTEQTYRWGDGQDRDRLMFDSLVVKPSWTWAFKVDRFMRLVAVWCWTGDGWVDVEPSKFAVLTWKKRSRDPRGHSGFDPAYNPWNQKLQLYPEFGEFLHHFADPIVWLMLGQNSQAIMSRDPATGKVTQTSAIDQGKAALAELKNRTGLVIPNGGSAGILSPGSEGGAYHGAFDRFDMEIFRAILFSSRAVQEAKHGSKADTDSNVKLYGMACQQGRVPLEQCLRRQVYRRWVRENWGEENAGLMTPEVSFGTPDHVQSDMLNAYATAFAKGFIDEAQLPAIWDKLGLPMVDEAATRARLEERKQRQGQGPKKTEVKVGKGN